MKKKKEDKRLLLSDVSRADPGSVVPTETENTVQ